MLPVTMRLRPNAAAIKADDDTAEYLRTMAGRAPAFDQGRTEGRRVGLEEAWRIAADVASRSDPGATAGFAKGWRAAADTIRAKLFTARSRE